MRQSDPSTLFSPVTRAPDAKGLRAGARAKNPDRTEPFQPALQNSESPARLRLDRRDADRNDVDRRDVGRRDADRRDADRRDDVHARENRRSDAKAHDAHKAERKPREAEPEPKPCGDNEPKGKEPAEGEPTEAEVEAGSDKTVDTCESAAPSGEMSEAAADTAQPLLLAELFGEVDVALAGQLDAVAPLQLAGEDAEPAPNAAPAPAQSSGEPARERGFGHAVAGAVHAVLTAAEKGAAKGAPAIAEVAEEGPSPDRHLGPQVSLAARTAVEGAGKGLAPGVTAKLARADTPAREAAPDFQPTDLRSAEAAAPHNLLNGANTAQPSAASAREADAASDKGQPIARDVPLGTVPIEIGVRAMAGIRRFEIRLDPADLGRIDVRLDMSDDGTIKAHLTVDKVETLALLQRDARTLERAFEQAGLKPSDGGVDLTLRDHSFAGHRQGGDGDQQRSGASAPIFITADQADERPAHLLWRGTTGLDVRV